MAATNPSLFRYDGRMGVDLSGNRVPLPTDDSWANEERDRAAREAASMASHRRLVKIGMLSSVVPFAAALAPGGALAGMFTGAGAGAGASTAASAAPGWSLPGVTAPVFGGGSGVATSTLPGAVSATSRLGSIFNSKGLNLGVNSALSLIGQHSQNKANDQARADALRAQQQQIDLELKKIAELKENNRLDRDQAQALADREYALQQRGMQLQEDAQKYQQGQDAAREARLAPYRKTSEQALSRLSSMWGL